ncbi:hypothetical protein [Thalassobius sp. Cn5-15]|uniref:hypothetical protein n=1 Tax=Thalassobius sp. Cn5-15 TaxID=2917763 RepID=UPI001EF342B7|nr:hypothetical protein [Thalassobius sp. Cn5-15]MCG7494140.1 hypothetical protein [Thalassobius sp. Cn5-15]
MLEIVVMLTSAFEKNPLHSLAVIELLREERRKSLSLREFKHRLMGYGYKIRQTARGAVVESVSSQKEICKLPHELMQ